MSLTNPNGRTNLFGFNISNVLMYGLILCAILVVVKIGVIFGNIFKSIKKFLGLSDDEDTEKNEQNIEENLKKDKAVQSQSKLTSTQVIAKDIFNAVDGFGLNEDLLYDSFRRITGPNQMKAVYLAYGERKVGIIWGYSFTGTLDVMLRWRLMSYQLNKELGKIGKHPVGWSIATKLSWLKK